MNHTVGLERPNSAKSLHGRMTGRARRRSRFRKLVLSVVWAISTALASGAIRLFDITLALVILAFTAPIWLTVVVGMSIRGRGVVRTARVGKWAEPFNEYSFPCDCPGASWLKRLHMLRLPALWNVLRGDMALIGPRATLPGELSPRDRIARRRYSVRPGFVCLWWVRTRANIAYDTEALSDSEYVDSRGFWGDVSLGLRAIPALFYGQGAAVAPEEFNLAGIRIHNLTMSEAVETILLWSVQSTSRQVAFVNADCANLAWKKPEYAAVLREADLTLGDGIGIKLGAAVLGQQLKQNVNGTDLFPRLCAAMQERSPGLFLLGGRPGVAENVRDWIAARYPTVNVVGCQHGYFGLDETQAVIGRIRESGAAILLVALGAPAQDLWIHENLPGTRAKVAIGVGGLFDFFSGRIPRAPQWLREIGLEWAYRLYQEPRRMWKRYLIGNLTFLLHVGVYRYRYTGVDQNRIRGGLA